MGFDERHVAAADENERCVDGGEGGAQTRERSRVPVGVGDVPRVGGESVGDNPLLFYVPDGDDRRGAGRLLNRRDDPLDERGAAEMGESLVAALKPGALAAGEDDTDRFGHRRA